MFNPSGKICLGEFLYIWQCFVPFGFIEAEAHCWTEILCEVKETGAYKLIIVVHNQSKREIMFLCRSN